MVFGAIAGAVVGAAKKAGSTGQKKSAATNNSKDDLAKAKEMNEQNSGKDAPVSAPPPKKEKPAVIPPKDKGGGEQAKQPVNVVAPKKEIEAPPSVVPPSVEKPGPSLNDLSAPITPVKEQTMVDDPANVAATIQAGEDAIANRNAPVEDPNAPTDDTEPKKWYEKEPPPLEENITPEAQRFDFEGAGTGTGEQGGGTGTGLGGVGTSGVTEGPLTPIPGSVEEQAPPGTTGVAQSERIIADSGRPLDRPPPEELDQSGRVKRPAFWKVALDAVFGQMPLIPGSKLATIPLARAREDYYKQDKRDQELTDTFLKEMGEGDWDRAKQLSKTSIFRDAVTRTMNMTPDDLINLDQQIQANSTESLKSIFKKGAAKRFETAVKAGGQLAPGSTYNPDDPSYPDLQGPAPERETVKGVLVERGADGDWYVAHDAEKAKEDRRIKQYEDAGYSRKEAVMATLTEGTGVPRYKNIKVGNGVMALYDQFSGSMKEFKFADAVKANMAMEIFEDEFGVAVGYVMYDKNKGAPTDLDKTTPIFFKDMEWGDQSKGKYTWYDAMRGRVIQAKEKGTSWNPLKWISDYMGGVEVTDHNKATPSGDEFSDYGQATQKGTKVNEQTAPATKAVSAPPVAPQSSGASTSEQDKANDFLGTATGSKPIGKSRRRGVDYSA
jgi:hypothetical protein